MKSKGTPAPAGQKLVWAVYGLAVPAFLAGLALLVAGKVALGLGLALLGLLLTTAVWAFSALASSFSAALRKAAAARGSAAAAAPRLHPRELGQALLEAAGAWAGRAAPGDSLRWARYWLLAPAAVLLCSSLYALGQGSTVKAVLLFALAALVAGVYQQAPERPLQLPRFRQNLLGGLSLLPALPLLAWGALELHTNYGKPLRVWLGFFLSAAGALWMLRSLKRRPLDLRLQGETIPSLCWEPPAPFNARPQLALRVSLAAAAAIAGLAATSLIPADYPGTAVSVGFLAMALLILSFPWLPSGAAWSQGLAPVPGALLAAGAALASFGVAAYAQTCMETGRPSQSLWLFLLSGVILVLGLSRFEGPAETPARETEPTSRWELAAVLGLVTLAFALRLWKVGVFPYGVEGDEGGGGVWAMDTLKGRVEHPLIHQNYPLAFFSVTALFFKLGGVGLTTLRLHSVIFGTLSVLTTYFFLRHLFGRWSAFLATALMAFSFWHLHYSRFGHYNIEQVALQMAAFYFVFKAMRSGRLWLWGAGGAAFGLALFPHMASRLLPFQGLALVGYFFMARRDLLRAHLPGFLAFVMAAWAVAAPAVVYWNRARTVSMGRIQSVSIFERNNSNAPKDLLDGFVRNCKVSILMFNDTSDSRSRDNPVAPERILERWTAALFAACFLYMLYHWRDPASFFLLSVFFVNLAASIFSVEAPQTLRTAGNIPIVYAIIALPMSHLRLALLRLGRARGTLLFTLLLVPAVAFLSWRSLQKYFVKARDLSFDVHPTYMAEVAGREGGPDTQGVFWGTGYASGHPPITLLARDTPMRNFYGPFEYLPISKEPDRDQLLFLTDDYQQMLPYLQWLYPRAPVQAIPNLLGGADLGKYVRVNRDLLQSSQGLSGQASLGGATRVLEGAEPQWPQAGLEGASRLALNGSVILDTFARYSARVTGRGDAAVSIDGQNLYSRRGGREQSRSFTLAKGLHSLSLRLEPRGSQEKMEVLLLAEPAVAGGLGGSWAQRGRSEFKLRRSQTLRVPINGLYGEYFSSRLLSGEPVVEVVEPLVLNRWLDSPLVGNWSSRWRARFRVTQPGQHSFSMRGGFNYAQVKVDGRAVFTQGSPPGGLQPQARLNQPIQLAAGWHEYEAVFATSGGPACELRWTPPGGSDTVFWLPELKPLPPRGRGGER